MGRMGTPLVKLETLKLLIFLEELLDKGDTKLPACWLPFFFPGFIVGFLLFFSQAKVWFVAVMTIFLLFVYKYFSLKIGRGEQGVGAFKSRK